MTTKKEKKEMSHIAHLVNVSNWAAKHEEHLKLLYKDFCKEGEMQNTSFNEFAIFMYNQCKHPKNG